MSEPLTTRACKDAWEKLRNEVLDEKTGWGKEELKHRMDKLLIETLETWMEQLKLVDALLWTILRREFNRSREMKE